MGDSDNRQNIVRQSATHVLHLFGGPYVTFDGCRQEVPEGSKRLLAFVALQRRRIERRHAAGALWPTGDDGRAAGNLRSALWRLRGAGIDVVTADKWSLSLSECVDVDVRVVGGWADRMIEGKMSGADLTVSPSWVDALDLLPGWYDDWALLERERLRQRTLHALEALSRRLVVERRHADAVEAAMLAVSAEPLRESAQRALIEAHLAEGNLAEARCGYRTYQRLLRKELGVDPSEDLLTLLRIPRMRPAPARPARTARGAVTPLPGAT